MSGIKLPNSIKMVVTDFDGVVTDNCVYINDDFSMSRKLNFKDVMGFSILKKNSYEISIISGEGNAAIQTMAKKFGIVEIHQNIRKKIDVLKNIVEKYNLSLDEFRMTLVDELKPKTEIFYDADNNDDTKESGDLDE